VPTTAAAAKGAVIVSAVGDIGPTVARYRSLLGSDNGGVPGRQPLGYREITWDTVPDRFAETECTRRHWDEILRGLSADIRVRRSGYPRRSCAGKRFGGAGREGVPR
jgi:hypothetical protein